ncbi:MFS transporter [Candidatus Albibeggiatoa sp. nov. BB20]|uniref:MFS transporter n=1 Tax=Candidatus Albibeggiatoa sp. nov. BB20 TaxID=3162723 RepID=UPI0033656E1F
MNQLSLLKSQRFFPLFLTQCLGAFNDNIYKNSLVILIIFQGDMLYNIPTTQLVTMSAGLFILPFFLFSATAGQLADKYEKAWVIQQTKRLEIVIMSLSFIGFYTHNIGFLIVLLFLMGMQSALFSPIKYAILPQQLQKEELMAGNGLLSMGGFLAILLGTILGGILISIADYGALLVSGIVFVVAILGYMTSLYIPKAAAPDADIKLNWNIFTQTWRTFQFALERKDVFIAIITASWFWFVGSTFLSQVPAYAKYVLGSNNEVITLLLFMFSFGIGLGSILCEKLSKGRIELGLVVVGTIGLILFPIDLYFASQPFVSLRLSAGELGLWQFLALDGSWRVLLDLALIGLFGGIYIVPLNTTVQQRSNPKFRARIISGANICNALFMVASAISIVVLLGFGFTIPQILLSQAVFTLLIVGVLFFIMPEFILSFLAWTGIQSRK